MDSNYIDNRHVLARYLADQLSEEELRDFEEYLVTNPAIVKDLEATARLKAGLNKLEKGGELAPLLKPMAWFRDSRILAMAASVAVLAVGVTIWMGRSALEGPKLVASLSALVDQSGKPLKVVDSYAILRTRGDAYDAEIELPSAAQGIELRVLPEIEAHPARYRVAIARIADDNSLTSIGTVTALTPAVDGFVALYFDSSTFKRGRYQLSISGDAGTDAASAISSFKLRLTTSVNSQPTP